MRWKTPGSRRVTWTMRNGDEVYKGTTNEYVILLIFKKLKVIIHVYLGTGRSCQKPAIENLVTLSYFFLTVLFNSGRNWLDFDK